MPLALPVPDLVPLELLQSVAELGSIARAAQAHGISQPAASMRLRSLERTLGLDLLDRSSGRARLTPAGLAVVHWSERILDGVHSLVAGAAALRNEGRTQLRIAASMTVAEYLVPRWIDRLRDTEPGLGISLHMGNSLQVVEMVKGRQVDLGFVEGRATSLHSKTGSSNLTILWSSSPPHILGPDVVARSLPPHWPPLRWSSARSDREHGKCSRWPWPRSSSQ